MFGKPYIHVQLYGLGRHQHDKKIYELNTILKRVTGQKCMTNTSQLISQAVGTIYTFCI